MSGSQSFAQPNFAGALGDGDEHDVDDADGAEPERDYAHDAEEPVHAIKDFGDALIVFDGVPASNVFFEFGIKAVLAGNDLMHFLLGDQMVRRA